MVLGADLLLDRAAVVADVEGLEVELLGGLGAPQAQGVGGVDAVAGDRRVVGTPLHDAVRDPAHAVAAAARRVHALGVAAELDVDSRSRAARPPTGCRSAASCRSPRPASRRGCPGRRCRTRSGCRSRWPGAAAWRASPGSRRRAARGRRCRGRAPPPARAASSRSSPSSAQRLARGALDGAQAEEVVAELRADQELGREVAGDRSTSCWAW